MLALRKYFNSPISIAPLCSFRLLFGAVMAWSVLRFLVNGWVEKLYIAPKFFFHYYGFEWVKPMGAFGLYAVFGLMFLSAIGIALGAFYRFAAVTFFLSWTYVELLDVTNYLNHYYFVALAAFLLIWLPAHRSFSVDAWRMPTKQLSQVPRWMLAVLRIQLGMVYVFAGLAKINTDWLLRAMPLKIWLASKTNLPLIGPLFKLPWVATAFAWMGCLYDLLVPFALLWKKTRPIAYAAVIGFHLITWWLFPIGMFPFIMILGTLVFFPGEWHEKWQARILSLFSKIRSASQKRDLGESPSPQGATWQRQFVGVLLMVHLLIQVLLPFRYLLYPKDLFWHEQGYRFSWRVMLMEKAGYATFRVRDPQTGKETEVDNLRFLDPNQERMMATQPDLILQFAHFLAAEYQQQGIASPEVYAEVYATLNGSGSRLLIDPRVNLAAEKEGFRPKSWILPFQLQSQSPILMP
jgi:hypothetical protein